MKRYEDMTADQRREEYAAVRKAYEAQKALGLKLNLSLIHISEPTRRS